MHSLVRLFMLAVLIALVNCGGATQVPIVAPPIELPAPTAGRITVSAPDATGKVTVTGIAEAVPAESIVLIINQSVAAPESVSPTAAAAKASDVPAFPPICTDPGHVCVYTPDGSFTAQIDASPGDVLAIGLVDAEGNIGALITLPVPSTASTMAAGACAAEGCDGSLIDFANVDGTPYFLFEGDENNASLLVSGETKLELPFCAATALSVFKNAGTLQAAIISGDGQLLITADLEHTPLISNAIAMGSIPLAVAHIGKGDRIVALIQDESRFSVVRLSLATGKIDKAIVISAPAGGASLDRLIRLDLVGPFNDGGYLGIAAFEGHDGASDKTFLSFFETSNFNDVTIDATPLDLTPFTGGRIMDDIQLAITDLEAGTVGLLMTADEGDELAIAHVNLARSGAPLTTGIPIAGIKSEGGLTLDTDTSSVIAPSGKKPKRFDISYTSTDAVAYVLVDDEAGLHHLWRIIDFGGNPLENVMSINSTPHPAFIAADETTTSVLIADDILGTALEVSQE